jgi:hypothetical protein
MLRGLASTSYRLRRVQTAQGNLDIEINSLSLKEYLAAKTAKLRLKIEGAKFGTTEDEVRELKDFGITTLQQLEPLFSPEFVKAVKAKDMYTTYSRLPITPRRNVTGIFVCEQRIGDLACVLSKDKSPLAVWCRRR